MGRPRPISGLLKLSRSLTRNQLEFLLGRRNACPACNSTQLNRYDWVKQGGPWLWCPACKWAGDAVQAAAYRLDVPIDEACRLAEVAESTEMHRSREVWWKWRRIAQAVTNGVAGTSRDLFGTELWYGGVRKLPVKDVAWDKTGMPEIGFASSLWLGCEFEHRFYKKTDERFIVLPVEQYPGLYTGLARVLIDQHNAIGGLELLPADKDDFTAGGWVGLSAAACSDREAVPFFLSTEQWRLWTFQDLCHRKRFPALTAVGTRLEERLGRLGQLLPLVFVAQNLDGSSLAAVRAAGGRHCSRLERDWDETRIHGAMRAARGLRDLPPCDTKPDGDKRSVVWRGGRIEDGDDGWYHNGKRVTNFRLVVEDRWVNVEGKTRKRQGFVVHNGRSVPFVQAGTGNELKQLIAATALDLKAEPEDMPVLRIGQQFGECRKHRPVDLGWDGRRGFVLSGLTISRTGVTESDADRLVKTGRPDTPSALRALRSRSVATLAAVVCANAAAAMFRLDPRCVSVVGPTKRVSRLLRTLGVRIVPPRHDRRRSLRRLKARASGWVSGRWPTALVVGDRADIRAGILQSLRVEFQSGRGNLFVLGERVDQGVWVSVRLSPRGNTAWDDLGSVVSTFLVWLLEQKNLQVGAYADLLNLYYKWLKHLGKRSGHVRSRITFKENPDE